MRTLRLNARLLLDGVHSRRPGGSTRRVRDTLLQLRTSEVDRLVRAEVEQLYSFEVLRDAKRGGRAVANVADREIAFEDIEDTCRQFLPIVDRNARASCCLCASLCFH